ncbi:unnamed protein product [Adineta steineri]|uniref:Uncharacterized protein n=1 Tax=Adineta steineri TaxID=433720 RepID=A0A820LK33_9BILA|nr:unnamed protein product [Adineta steineri]
MKLFNHEPMQTVLSSMNQLVQLSDENNSSILSTSTQLSSELVIQCWFLYNQSLQFQYLYGLFLSELLQLDIHSNLINHFLTMSNIRQVKFYAYEAIISSNTFQHIYNFYSNIYSTKESIINSTNLSLIYPTNINHLYSFIRLFNTELNLNQIQHTMDTCIYSIQQFLSLPFITESTCRNFSIILRLLTYLTNNNMNENLK